MSSIAKRAPNWLDNFEAILSSWPQEIVARAIQEQCDIADFDQYLTNIFASLKACQGAGIPRPKHFEKALQHWAFWFETRIKKQHEAIIREHFSAPDYKARTPRAKAMRRDLDAGLKAYDTVSLVWKRRMDYYKNEKFTVRQQVQYVPGLYRIELERYAKERYGKTGKAYLDFRFWERNKAFSQQYPTAKPFTTEYETTQRIADDVAARYRKPRGRPGDHDRACIAIHLLNSRLEMRLVLVLLNAMEGRDRFQTDLNCFNLPGDISVKLYTWLKKIQMGPMRSHLPKLNPRRQ